MEETQQYEIIARYLSGELSGQEKTQFEQWLSENSANQQLFEETKQVWELSNEYHDPIDVDSSAAWNRFEQKMEQPEVDTPPTVQKTAKTFRIGQLLRIAAVLIGVAGLAIWLFQNQGNSNNWIAVQTALGEQKEITLPDGSTIWMNADSKIMYAHDFAENRQVTLSGEAFFDVQRKETHPFTIESGKTLTTVLGTSFNIRAYPAESSVEVKVESGKVSFAEKLGTNEPIILIKDEKGTLDKKAWQLKKTKPLLDNSLAWRSKNIAFDNTNMKMVIQDLERYYQIAIETQNASILNCHFTGTFKNRNLSEVLKALQFALNISTSKTDKLYTFSGPGCVAN